MNSTDKKELSAQGAEIQRHLQIMEELRGVRGMMSSYVYINGNCYYWSVSKLPEHEVINIARRGNHSEIMLMIEQYGKAAPSPDWDKHRYCAYYHNDHILPDEVQNVIAERMNLEEIEAYIRYQGFGASAQEIFLKKSDHDMRMRYINRHGFVPEVQKKLVAGGNADEIKLHFQRHGFCLEIEKALILNKQFADVQALLETHELSVEGQKEFCRTACSKTFDFYINRYGFWNEVHPVMVEYRSMYEIQNYISRHRFLSKEGEQALARKGNRGLICFYVDHKAYRNYIYLADSLEAQSGEYALEAMICRRLSERFDFAKSEKKFLSDAKKIDVLSYLDRFKPDDSSVSALIERGDEDLLAHYKAKYC